MVSNFDAASSKEVVLMLINLFIVSSIFFSWSLFGFFVVRFYLTILVS